MLKSSFHLPNAIVRPHRTFRSRLKALVTLVLLISVLISSCLLVHGAQAQTQPQPATVFVHPYEGYWNPLANSGLLPYKSGFEENSTWLFGDESTYTQHMDEAAVYANGKEPMVFATSHASSAVDPRYGESVVSLGSAGAAVGGWSYLIFDKTTGKPLDSNRYYESIPVDLSYSMSLSASGVSAVAEGGVGVYGNIYGSAGLFAHRMEAAGSEVDWAQSQMEANNESYPGSPAAGTLSYNYQGYGGLLRTTVYVNVDTMAGVVGAIGPGWPEGSSDAQAEVDCHVFIDPSSPLAGQLQIYVAKTANANANDLSQWTPTGNTSPTTPTPAPTAPTTTPTQLTPTPTPTPRMTPTIMLQPAQGRVFSITGFTLLHFTPNTDVNIIFPTSQAMWVTDAHTGPDGTARGFMKVPYTTPGPYTVTATDSAGDYATTSFTVILTPETVIITSYYGTEISVKHAGSPDWIELTDPTSYVWQEGDTIATVKNTVIQIELGTHGVASLEPDSELFVSSISESDVTFSVKGNFYQNTDDTVTVQTINGVQIITDSSSNQAIQSKVGDPQFIITTTNTSALIQVYEGVVTLNDSSGNLVPIGAGYQLNVTMGQTSASPEPMNDTTPPSVTSVFPVSYEPSINESMPISVTFSKAIDPTSAAGYNFTITSSKGAPVSGYWTVLYRTVIFTPQSSVPGGTYTVDVKGGSEGVRDLSGNTLASDYTFTFTGGANANGGSANPLAITFGSAAFILIVVAVVVVAICAVALVARKMTRTRSVSKSSNQAAPALLCPQCGKTLPKSNAKFCPFCGAALKTGE